MAAGLQYVRRLWSCTATMRRSQQGCVGLAGHEGSLLWLTGATLIYVIPVWTPCAQFLLMYVIPVYMPCGIHG